MSAGIPLACGGADDPDAVSGGSGVAAQLIHSESYDTFTPTTVAELVTYSDALVVAKVVGERALPSSMADEYGEGPVGREVTVEVVSSLWQGRRDDEIPASMSFLTDGWHLKDRTRIPVSSGGAWMEVGSVYLVPLTYFDDLAPIAPSYVFEIAAEEPGRVDESVDAVVPRDSTLPERYHLLDGLTLREVAERFRTAELLPGASRSVSAQQRQVAVLAQERRQE